MGQFMNRRLPLRWDKSCCSISTGLFFSPAQDNIGHETHLLITKETVVSGQACFMKEEVKRLDAAAACVEGSSSKRPASGGGWSTWLLACKSCWRCADGKIMSSQQATASGAAFAVHDWMGGSEAPRACCLSAWLNTAGCWRWWIGR